MPDSGPSVILTGIRERQSFASDTDHSWSRIEERHDALIKVAYEDTPRLLAAVEAALAALARHQHKISDSQGTICAGCLREWPCPDTAAITAALTGTQLGEDENHG